MVYFFAGGFTLKTKLNRPTPNLPNLHLNYPNENNNK